MSMKTQRLPQIEDGLSQPISVRLHKTEWEELREIAEAKGFKRNQLIRQILVSAIEQTKADTTA
jgi:predicted DNA-binding ribbon-helix-helix protein